MFREIMAIRTFQMMTSRSLICLLENQNGGKLQKHTFNTVIYKEQFLIKLASTKNVTFNVSCIKKIFF
jgi:hypothetical protein